MEIRLSVSSVKPKTFTMSAADTEAVAQELLPKLHRLAKGGVSAAELGAHAADLVASWVKSAKTRDFSPEARSKSASRIVTKLLAAFKKPTGDKVPLGVSVPDGRDSTAKKLSKADIEKIAERLSHSVKFSGAVDNKTKEKAVNRIVTEWTSMHSVQYPAATRLLNQSAVSLKLVELINKKGAGAGGKAPVSAPKDKVVPITKAATKEEKLKAQILAGTKLRNQFAAMLTKKPALTSKSIEALRKNCEAYFKVITSVQKGNKDLEEVTKIEGLRGIDAVKNYVYSVYGLTYGYVELAKAMSGTQAEFKDRVMDKIVPESVTKVELRRKAKDNAQRALMNVTKQLGKRGCRTPVKFGNDMQRIFATAAESGDFKKAKADARALIDGLVSAVFTRKVKLYAVTD